MPWGLIATVLLKLIDILLSRSNQKEKTKRDMLDFIKKYDSGVMDNAKLKKEYDAILRREYLARKKGEK